MRASLLPVPVLWVSQPMPCGHAVIVHACASPIEQPFKVEGPLLLQPDPDGAAAAEAGA